MPKPVKPDPSCPVDVPGDNVPDHDQVIVEAGVFHHPELVGLVGLATLPQPCAIPGVDLTDYSLTAEQKGWGPPCTGPFFVVPLSSGAHVTVDSRIRNIVKLVMEANIRDGYSYRAADTGAYNCRHIASNPALPWSNHAWALAIDCNWQTNPQHFPLITDRPGWEIARWNRFGFAWGGDYHYPTAPDAMHVEFMGTPAQAILAEALAYKELAPQPVPVPVPVPVPAPKPVPAPAPQPDAPGPNRVLREGDSGTDVRNLQHVLNAWYPNANLVEDGDFGPKTTAQVKVLQQNSNLTADGIVGSATKAVLHL